MRHNSFYTPYEFRRQEKKAYPLTLLCSVMDVSRSGYYDFVKRMKLNQRDVVQERLLIEVKMLAKESQDSYGSRLMSKRLQSKGYAIGRYAARSLMKKAGVVCKQRRRYRVTTQSSHYLPVADNLLNRQFIAEKPNQVWLTDITYLWTHEGWLYIAAILDLFSRGVVGWAMAKHMREELVQNALQMAVGRRQPQKGLLHHSDQGVQYASSGYQETLKKLGCTISMSRKGNCWDNAVRERLWGSLKSERTDGKIYFTREQAKADVVDYFEMFYNHIWPHSTLGYLSPMQFENQFA